MCVSDTTLNVYFMYITKMSVCASEIIRLYDRERLLLSLDYSGQIKTRSLMRKSVLVIIIILIIIINKLPDYTVCI